MAVWILVERLENWLVDEAEGFGRFGLSATAAKRAGEIRKGDQLIFYVSSGISALVDIREAIADGVERLRFGGDYDTAYPVAVRTKPVLILPRDKWLPMRDVAPYLPMFHGKDWRWSMQFTLRKLSDQDSAILIEQMRAQAESIMSPTKEVRAE
jgi:hypothetical protein